MGGLRPAWAAQQNRLRKPKRGKRPFNHNADYRYPGVSAISRETLLHHCFPNWLLTVFTLPQPPFFCFVFFFETVSYCIASLELAV